MLSPSQQNTQARPGSATPLAPQLRSRTWTCSNQPGSKLDTTTERASVALEVDAIDEATRTGWSMVVRDPLAKSPTPPTWGGIINISSVIGEKGQHRPGHLCRGQVGAVRVTNSLAPGDGP
jgi:hypothetical protein